MRRFIFLLLITGTVWAQTDFDKLLPVLDYEHLSIKGKAIYDAKKDAKKWLFFPPTAVLTLAVSSFPYLLLEALTSKKTENFSSKDKQLYEKVYFEEYKKRKYKNIMISTGCTALLAGAVLFSFFSNFGFGSDYDIYVGP